ncbi:hypothetical protein Tsubulata_047129 [Turnera subulata]|uniref:Chromo domain-containing protein n=1 Tax=Turnera subulata TaxID=218843 RepID=A0A9Q0FZQ4_9ROSI|nr:hypothetical protein Tsubulata_047129 [Turnera subulata]
MILQPAEVLDMRVLQENDARVEEWLIRWEGLPSSAATWENKADLCRKYPSMNLEDKVQSGDGGIVMGKAQRDQVQQLSEGPGQEDEAHPKQNTVSVGETPRRSTRAKEPSRRLDGYIL